MTVVLRFLYMEHFNHQADSHLPGEEPLYILPTEALKVTFRFKEQNS